MGIMYRSAVDKYSKEIQRRKKGRSLVVGQVEKTLRPKNSCKKSGIKMAIDAGNNGKKSEGILYYIQHSYRRTKTLQNGLGKRFKNIQTVYLQYKQIMQSAPYLLRCPGNWRIKWTLAHTLYSYAKRNTELLEERPKRFRNTSTE